MTSYTNLSQNMNLTSLIDILKQANTNTGDAFWTGIYWMIVAIILLSTLNFGFEIAVLVALFAGMIMGIFLVYLGLLSMTIFGMTEAFMLFLVIYLIYTSNKNQ